MNNLTQPAYPVVPLQDNFKRLVVPIPGLSKLEHYALELYKSYKICLSKILKLYYQIWTQINHQKKMMIN